MIKLLTEIEKIILDYAGLCYCGKCRKLTHNRGYELNGKIVCIKCLYSCLNFLYNGLRFNQNQNHFAKPH